MRKTPVLTSIPCRLFAIFLLVNLAHADGKKNRPGSLSRRVDRTLSYALESAQPFVLQGFTVREDYWSGMLDQTTQKIVTAQLLKGNEYWFCAASDADGAIISVHVYDASGDLAETEYWRKLHAAGAHVVPRRSGGYYVVMTIEKATPESRWALIYSFL